MSWALLLSRGRTAARLRDPAPPRAATDAEALVPLARAIGNRAVARLLARRPHDAAPPIKDRTRIDQLAKTKGQAAADRCRAYAEIAGTQWVQMDPTTVHTSPFYQDGVNLDALKQARDVPATTYWLDDANRPSGGAPPERIKGVAIVVNSNSDRFEDADYMVAAIRHEMVHARLMRLTLKHLTDWKRGQTGLSFTQYVDKRIAGTDAARVKDRYFGGHMDEVVAYLDGPLTPTTTALSRRRTPTTTVPGSATSRGSPRSSRRPASTAASCRSASRASRRRHRDEAERERGRLGGGTGAQGLLRCRRRRAAPEPGGLGAAPLQDQGLLRRRAEADLQGGDEGKDDARAEALGK